MTAWHSQLSVGGTVVAGQVDVAVAGEYEVFPELERRRRRCRPLSGPGWGRCTGLSSGKVFFENDWQVCAGCLPDGLLHSFAS